MRGVLTAVAVCLVAPTAAWAQASLAGAVKDTSGGVLPGVGVEAASPALIEKVRTAVTDGSGRYRVEDLRPRTDTLTVALPGLVTLKHDGLVLSGSAVTPVDAEPCVGGVCGAVT